MHLERCASSDWCGIENCDRQRAELQGHFHRDPGTARRVRDRELAGARAAWVRRVVIAELPTTHVVGEVHRDRERPGRGDRDQDCPRDGHVHSPGARKLVDADDAPWDEPCPLDRNLHFARLGEVVGRRESDGFAATARGREGRIHRARLTHRDHTAAGARAVPRPALEGRACARGRGQRYRGTTCEVGAARGAAVDSGRGRADGTRARTRLRH